MEKFALSSLNDAWHRIVFSFLFHVLPGLLFFANGLWLAINVFQRYYRSTPTTDQEPFRSHLWYAGPCTKKIPLDGVMRCILFLFVTIFLTVSLFQSDWFLPENMQHTILFLGHFLGSLIEVRACFIKYQAYSPHGTPLGLPRGFDRVVAILSWVVSFFIFYFHFHSESPIQSQLHIFFYWLAAIMVMAHLAESHNQGNVWLALMRPYILFLIGQWGCQVAFIMYLPVPWPRNWDDGSISSIVMVNFLFSCHLVTSFVVLIVTGGFVRLGERKNQHFLLLSTTDTNQKLIH